MSEPRIFIISGPSGSGKNTLIRRVLELDNSIKFSISATTRPPRGDEADGVDYFFISPEKFERLIEQDGLIEYAEYCGNLYGTPREKLMDWIESGHNVLLEIEVQGAQIVREKLPEAVSVFIMPPSAEALEQRLRLRQTDSEAAIRQRLQTAEEEMCLADQYDHVLVNDVLDDAARQLIDIIYS